MTENAIRVISHVFILCGLVLFVTAVALAIIRERQHRKSTYPFKVTEQKTQKQKEFRRLKRANYEKDIKYSHAEPPYAEGTAKGKDLHQQGAGLMMPIHAKVKRGTKLDLELFLDGQPEPMRIAGEIVWTEGLEDEKMEKLSLISEFFARRVGVKFKDMSEDNVQRIKIAVKGVVAEDQEENA
jgi:hypothetical protein